MATSDGGVATEATIELILAVRDAVDDLWKAHAAEIKQRCGPSMPEGLIAKQEVFGFALADAVGRPRLPGDRAMRVGQNGDNAVRSAEGSKDRKGKLTAAREAARAAVRKAQRAAAKDAALEPGVAAAEAAGEAVIAAVLTVTVDLDLPNETVGAVKRKRGITSTAPATAEPALEALRATAKKARVTFEGTQAVQAADGLRAKRAMQRLDDVCDRAPEEPDYRPVPPFENEDGYLEAFEEWRDACNKDLKKAMAAVTKWKVEFSAAEAMFSTARMEWMVSCEASRDAEIALTKAERAVNDAEWREADNALRETEAQIACMELAVKELGRCTCKEYARV